MASGVQATALLPTSQHASKQGDGSNLHELRQGLKELDLSGMLHGLPCLSVSCMLLHALVHLSPHAQRSGQGFISR